MFVLFGEIYAEIFSDIVAGLLGRARHERSRMIRDEIIFFQQEDSNILNIAKRNGGNFA